MKRVALSVVLLLVWLAPRLESTAVTCVSRNPCKQPPCEFFYQLKMTKAMARAWDTRVVRNPDDHSRITAKMNKAYKKYAKCPANYFYQPPPNFSVSSRPQCQLGYPSGTSSLDQVMATTNACAELVRATFARAEQMRLFCLANKDMDANSPLPEGQFRMEMRLAYQAAAESLESDLGRFLSSCAPSATTSRHITEAGLQALRRTAYKNRMEWADRLVREVAQ